MKKENTKKQLKALLFIVSFLFFMVALLSYVGISEDTAHALIDKTTIKKDLSCYSGSTYKHHINVYLSYSSNVYSHNGKYYTKGTDLFIQFDRGTHNTGTGLSAHNHDMAGWVIFQLVNSNNSVVSSKKFYQAYYNDKPINSNVVYDSGSFSLSFEGQTGSFSLRVITNYFRDDKNVSDDAWVNGQYNSTTNNSYQKKSSQSILNIDRDISAPTLSCEIANYGYINKAFTVYASDNWSGVQKINYKVGDNTLFTSHNDSSITINATSQNGLYEFYAIDVLDNESAHYFVNLDTIVPSIKVSGLTNGIYSNQNVSVTYSDLNLWSAEYTLNGTTASFASGTTFSDDGSYTVRVTDIAGNYTERTFFVDKTVPIISANGLTNGIYGNQDVTVLFTDDNLKSAVYTVNGENAVPFSSGTTFSEDGIYEISVEDIVGHIQKTSFIIDKVNPIVEGYKKSGESFVDGAKINDLVYFAAEDTCNVTYTFYQKIGSDYLQLARWDNYQQKTIYFDKRELNYSMKLYSNEHIFYTIYEAHTYIRNLEEKRIAKKNNWTTATQGTIIESETKYSSTGADYWLYTTSIGEKYVFFSEERARSYIESNLGDYCLSSSIYYFYEEGDFKIRVTDQAGNYTEKIFIVDFTEPTSSLINVTNGYAKGEFSFQASDGLSGFSHIEYQKPGSSDWISVTKTSITILKSSGDGKYSFRAYDKAGNVTAISAVTLDTTAPAVSLNEFYKAGQTVNPVITETNFSHITLSTSNNTVYSGAQQTWNTSMDLNECTYVLTVYDKAGNSRSVNFTIDRTAPAFTVNDYYNASETVLIEITETHLDTVTYDGKTLSVVNKKASIVTSNLSDGTHTVIAYDKAGNSTKKSFIVDKTAPEFNVNEYYNASETVTISIAEKNLKNVMLDGAEQGAVRSWNSNNLSEGEHQIVVRDKAENITAKTFIVDKIAPEFGLNAFYNASETVTLSITEVNLDTVTLDGTVTHSRAFVVSELEEGTHTVVVYDKARNNTRKTFIVDKTAPIFSVNPYYKAGQTISLSITETNLNSVYLDGIEQGAKRSWKSDNFTNGTHTLVVNDLAGNYTQKSFVVDKIAPEFSLNAFYNASETVSLVITEINLDTVTLDGSPTTEREFAVSFLDDGTHTIIAYDKAGNSTSRSFIVDKTLPSVAVNSYYKGGQTVNPVITETNFSHITLTINNNTVYSGAQQTWNTSTDLNECTYVLTVYDLAGNQKSTSFTVDRTAPAFSVKAYYNASESVTIAINELNFSKAMYDGNNLAVVNKKATIPISGLAEGTHNIVVTDFAGNSTSKMFIVDKTLPIFSVDAFYKANQTVSISVTEINLNTVTLDGTVQGETRKWNSNNLTNGAHTIIVTDLAGNSTTKTFIVDKVVPEFSVNAFYNAGQTVNISITELNLDTVTLDGTVQGTARSWNTNALSEGIHIIRASDKAGNYTEKSFYVDKTAPSVALSAYYKGGQIVNPVITETNFAYVTLTTGSNTVYSGAQRTWNTSADLTECTYVLTVYDLAGNQKSASFTVDRTAPIFSVKDYYNASETVTISITELNFDYITFDDEATERNSFNVVELNDGTHTVIAYDKAGNNTKKTFIVDKTAPVFSVDAFYKAGQTVSISITEVNLATVTLDGTEQGSARSWNTNALSEGTHVIVVTDKAGNYYEKSFYVDKTAPQFSVNAFYNATETITLSISEVNFDYVTLDGTVTTERSFVASMLEDGTHTFIAYDKAGNSTSKSFIVDKVAPDFTINSYYKAGQTLVLKITETNLDYVFVSTIGTTTITQFYINNFNDGEYEVTAVDFAGNSTKKSFIVDKTAPEFSFNAFYNASETIKLTITEKNLNYVMLDGDIITNYNVAASTLDDGVHTVVVSDFAGNEKSKTFIVDKTAPIFNLKEFYAANETISLVVEEEYLDFVTLDDVTVAARSWDATTLSEGAHTIVVYDKAKNQTSASFYFKTAQPLLSFRKNGASASSGVFLAAGDDIEVVISDAQFDYLTLDGVKVSDLTELENYQWTQTWEADDLVEGTHTVVVYDKASNETTLVFSIDRTPPSLTFKVNGSVVMEYVYVSEKDNLSFTFSDMNIDRTELDGEVTTTTQYSAAALSEYGHTFVVYDKAGNCATVKFYVDRTAPSFTLEGFYNGERDISLSIIEANLDYIAFDGERILSNAVSLSDVEEGTHIVTVCDKAGNATSRSFVLDRTAPQFTTKDYYKANEVILLSVVEDNLDRITLDGATTAATSWLGSELPDGTHTVIAYDKAGNATTQTFCVDTFVPGIVTKKNGNVMQSGIFYAAEADVVSIEITESNLGTVTFDGKDTTQRKFTAALFEDGAHTVVALDFAGNSTTVSFVVDKTAPDIILRKNGSSVETGAFYRENTTVSLIVEDANLLRIELDGVASEKNSWLASELYEGEHIVTAHDFAGNSTTVIFNVDKTVPQVFLEAYYGIGETIVISQDSDTNFAYVTLRYGSTVIYEGNSRTWNTDDLDERTYVLTIYDLAENSTTVSFVVDKTAPDFTLDAFYNATQTIRIRINESNLNYVMFDDEVTEQTSYLASSLEDGIHTVVAVDFAGNRTSRSFVVDKVAPELIISKEYLCAEDTVKIEVNEINLDYVTLNGDITGAQTFIISDFEEGTYTVIVYDKAGNSTRKTFVVDKTVPEFDIEAFYKVGQTVSISITEVNLATVTLDGTEQGSARSWNTNALSEGTHVIVVTDKAGNYYEKSFYVDKTAPQFSVNAFYNATETITLSISEVNFDYVTLDGTVTTERSFVASMLEDGTHTFIAYDKAGNSTSKSFIVDKTVPDFTLDEFYNATQTVRIRINESNLSYFTLDDEVTEQTSYLASSLEDGIHSVVAVDFAGNRTSRSFVVDKVAPELIISKEYLCAEDTVKIEVNEINLDYVTLNGDVTEVNTFDSAELEEGLHTIIAFDKAGNNTRKTFIVDKTAPVFTVNDFYKGEQTVTISITEPNLGAVTLDKTEQSSTRNWRTDNLSEGTHVIVVTDKAGNYTEKSFYVDKTAPQFSVNAFYNAAETITLSISEINFDYITFDGTATNSHAFTVSELEEGVHTVVAYDKAGNNTKKAFIVDKTAPVFTVNEFYKGGQTVSISVIEANLDSVTLDRTEQGATRNWRTDNLSEGTHVIIVTDKAGNATECSFIVDRTAPVLFINEFYNASDTVELQVEEDYLLRITLNGEEVNGLNMPASEMQEGKYTVIAYDKAGNGTSKLFTVDKTAPEFTLNAFYNASGIVRIRVSDMNFDYITLDEDFVESTNIQAATLEDGVHTVVAYDKAGNTTKKTFIVDKTAPILYLAEYYSVGKNVYLQPLEENVEYIELDGAITQEEIILSDNLSDGIHTVKIVDLAGNSMTVSFVVDKIAPEFYLNEFYRSADTVSLKITENNLRYVELDGMTTELTSWQCANLSEGEHVVKAVDFAGNSTAQTFIIDKTYPVISLTNDGKPLDTSFFTADVVFLIHVTESYLDTVTINGNIVTDYTVIVSTLEDGKYTVIAVDKAGNTVSTEFTVDKTAPSVTLRRNMADIESEGAYISSFDTVSVVVEDVNLERVLFNGVDTIVYSWTGSSLSDGEHIVTAYDKAGNVTTVSFIVHKGAPEFTLQEYYIAGETVSLDVSEETLDCVLLDEAETFLRQWTAEELGEGLHTLSVTDKAGNVTTKTFIVDTLNPTVELNKNSQKTDGIVYAKATDLISITVSDENLDYVLFDNEVTDKRSWECLLLDEREHFIVVSDKAQNKTTVSFIVDRTAPVFDVKEYYLTGETVFIDIEESNPDGVYLDGERIFVSSFVTDELEERTYILTVYDKAGNVTEKSFTVDLSSPIISVVGKSVDGEESEITQGKNSYGEVKICAFDIADYTLYISRNEADYIDYGTDFTITVKTENEGNWRVYAVDTNGYVSETVTFTVDFTAPKVVIFDTDADEAKKGYTNTAFTVRIDDVFPDKLYYKHERDEDFSLCSQTTFTAEATLEYEGTYLFYAVDKNGLFSEERKVILDLGAPTFALNGLVTKTEDKGYTNTSFGYSASDYHFSAIYFKKAGSTETFSMPETSLAIENTKENEGTWLIYAEDIFGQRTPAYSVTLNFTFDFHNIENIGNSFKQNTWYTVTLPSRIYSATSKPDISGKYSFGNYEAALAFAVAKEKEYRVYSVTEGGYGYVSVNNENVYVTYPTEAELEKAVFHYAVKYVSERKIFNKTEARNVYDTITNDGFIPDVTALTDNEFDTPDFLKDYGLPVYFARQSFVPINNSAFSPSSVRLTYVGNLTGAVEPYTFDLFYGESFSAALSRASNLYEGFYLYEESDLCGNSQRAIIFIDLSEPTLKARVERGDGTEDLTINKDAVGDRSGVFYAVSFKIFELLDNADKDYVCVNIVSDKYAGTFTAGDELPVLSADFGAGTYSITVYDRSYNYLTFTVIIAGAAPSWSYTSLAANTKKLSVYINKNDRDNALLTLRLVKIRSDGTYVDIIEDSEGTAITPANGVYVFTDGGKYAAIMTDMYGRTVETEPIFYEKGLPSATFDGVRNGGTTNSNVSITYADTYGLRLYYDNAQKTPVNGIQPVYDASKKTFTVTIERTPEQTINYLVFVYLLADEGIYIEYAFTIDCEAPLFNIEANDGTSVGANGSTNKPFFVSWLEDNVTAKVQREGYNLQTYQSGTVLTLNTLYKFILTDKVGNEIRFTVYLDSEVLFGFSAGVTTQEEGYVLTKNPQKITVNEEYTAFGLTDGDGNAYAEGEEIGEGFYTLTIEDVYGNKLSLEIEIDLTAPVLILENVKENNLSNQDVTVSCDETSVTIETVTSRGTTDGEIKNGTVFFDEGTYTVRATDKAGNSTTHTFTIDKTIRYTCTGENGLFTTSNVSFAFSENVTQIVTKYGEECEASLRFSDKGEYVVKLIDDAGNKETISFTILSERQQKLIIEDTNGFYVSKITLNGEETESAANSIMLTQSGKYEVTLFSPETNKSYYFPVEIDNTAPELVLVKKNGKVSFSGLTETGVTFTLYKDGKIVEGINSKSAVTEKGNYVLIITDECGNETKYDFDIKFTLNAISIALIAIGAAVAVLLIVLFIKGHRIKAA